MSQSVSKRFIVFAVVGIVVAVVIVAAPPAAEKYATSHIERRASATGFDVTWDEMELRWTGSAVLTGVELVAPSRGLKARAATLTLNVEHGSVIQGKPRLSGVGASGTTVRWNPNAEAIEGARSGGENADGASLARVIEELEFIDVIDTTVVIESDDEPVELLINSISVDDGHVQGRARWQSMMLPGGLRVQEQDCSFRGEWPGGLEPLNLEVRAANNEPVISVTRGDRARLDVHHMTVRLEPKHRHARLDLREIRASLGESARSLVRLEAPVASFGISPGERPAAVVLAPKVTVNPSKWTAASAGAGGAGASAESDASSTGVAVLDALQEMELAVDDGAVELVLGSRTLEIIEALKVGVVGRQVIANGRSAKGSFELNLGFGATSLVPESVQASFEDVRLGAIPGMNEGRTLPKRGFRGRLDGILDASLTLLRDADAGPLSASTLAVEAEWRDGTIDVAGLAEEPLEDISASFSFESEFRPQLGDVRLKNGRATYGPMTVGFDGHVNDWPLDTTFSLGASLEKIECQKAIRSLPDTLLGAYREVELEGSMAPTFSLHLPWRRPDRLELSMSGFVDRCEVTALNTHEDAWPKLSFEESARGQEPNPSVPAEPVPSGRDPSNLDDVYWMNRPFVMRVTEGVSEDAEVYVGPGLDSYVSLHELPEYVGAAAYLSEEMNFYENHAVDLGHIQKALRMNLKGGEFVYGGSTVDQQLIKNLFLSRDKTLARKLQEALIGWRTEDVVSKDRILELYLNCIEYGDDLYGIGPAATYYFGKDARELTPEEATLLAIIKPAPWYGERFKRKGTTPTKHWWFDRMGEIMDRLVDREFITEEQAEQAKPYVLQWDEDGTYLPAGEDTQDDDDQMWDLLDMDPDDAIDRAAE